MSFSSEIFLADVFCSKMGNAYDIEMHLFPRMVSLYPNLNKAM